MLRGLLDVRGGGIEAKAATGNGIITDERLNELNETYFKDKEYNRVSVHDPSIVTGYIDEKNYTGSEHVYGVQNSTNTRKEVYFIFGSHMAFAWSVDLQDWTTFENNINRDYRTIFKRNFEWSANGDSVYDPSGNMWAPDVFWDAEYNNGKGAWLMYMSINGCSWNSSIVLLTADSLNGDWTCKEDIIYSGFNADTASPYSYKKTNYEEFGELDNGNLPSRYSQGKYTCKDGETACEATTWNKAYGAHAIDPCITYDNEGNLWMSYGSWSGGIYIIKIDPSTGLRDKNTTYKYDKNVSDPYMGYKLAGGNQKSGEASYIEYINGRYYMFLSYGGFAPTGGYNMRIFSSDKITGPYKDLQGQDARFGNASSGYPQGTYSEGAGNTTGTTGSRLMSYYKWSFLKNGYTAQGHNSAFVDDDGKAYVIYHNKTDDGTEGHQVRVHQLFTTENKGLVAAPFEYSGETLADKAYATEDVTGEYGILYMDPSYSINNVNCVQEETIQLNADGTVSGDRAGTWQQQAGKPYVDITVGGVSYKGVFVEQNIEETGYKTMCFTVIGNNDVSIWGYRKTDNGQPFDDEAIVVYNANNLKAQIPSQVFIGNVLDFADEGHYGASYSWQPADTRLVSADGKVQHVDEDTETQVLLTITKGNYSYEKTIDFKILSQESKSKLLPIGVESIQAEYNTKAEANEAMPAARISKNTGLSLSMYADGLKSDWDNIFKNKAGSFQFQFATISYSQGGTWCWYYENAAIISEYAKDMGYDNVNIWKAFSDGHYYLTISFNTDGTISYYRDGHLMMKYDASLVPSNNPGNLNTDISKIAAEVIAEYKSGNIEFAWDVSNIVVGYAADYDPSAEQVLIDGYEYYEDYDYKGTVDSWASHSKVDITMQADADYGNYIQAAIQSTEAGNRGTINEFSSNVSDLENYLVEMDVALTGGTMNGRSESQLMLMDTNNKAVNSSVQPKDSSIFMIKTNTYSNTDPSTRTTWYVNEETDKSFILPVDTWVTIKVKVTNNSSVEYKIVNRADGALIYSGNTTVNGNGHLKGISTIAGRYNGVTKIDNIKVSRVYDNTINVNNEYKYGDTAVLENLGTTEVYNQVIGNKDKTTPFDGAASDDYKLTGDFNTTFTFNNYGGALVYNNYAMRFSDAVRGADGASDYVVVRGDDWGWGGGDNRTKSGNEIHYSHDYQDADALIDIMNSAKVTANVQRKGKDVTISVEAVSLKDSSKSYTRTVNFTETDADMYFTLLVDNSYIEMVSVEGLAQVGPDDRVIAGFQDWSDYTNLKDDFDITFDFDNHGTDTDSWLNYYFEFRNDSGGYVTMRSDRWGWSSDGGPSDPNKAPDGSNIDYTGTTINWDTFKSIMSDAHVVMNITRSSGVIQVDADVVSNTDNTQSYKYMVKFAMPGEEVNVRFTVENAYIKMNKITYNPELVDNNTGSGDAVQWYRTAALDSAGAKIPGATEKSYVIQKEDAGNYIYAVTGNNKVVFTNKVKGVPISIKDVEVNDKEYDGIREASVKSVSFNGLLNEDNPEYTADLIFDTATPGTGKKVTGTLALKGVWSKCYILSDNKVSTTGNITGTVPPQEPDDPTATPPDPSEPGEEDASLMDGLIAEYLFNGNLKDSKNPLKEAEIIFVNDEGQDNESKIVTDKERGKVMEMRGTFQATGYLGFDKDYVNGIGNAFTVSMWAKANNSKQGEDGICGGMTSIFNFKTTADNYTADGYKYGFVSLDTSLCPWINDGNGNWADRKVGSDSTDVNLSTETWKQVVMSIDGDNNKIYVYVDGELSETVSGLAGGTCAELLESIKANTTAIQIGTFLPWWPAWDFRGYVDDVRMYNKVLDAGDVKKLYSRQGDKSVIVTGPTEPSVPTGDPGEEKYKISYITKEGAFENAVVSLDKTEIGKDETAILTIKPKTGYEFKDGTGISVVKTAGTCTIGSQEKNGDGSYSYKISGLGSNCEVCVSAIAVIKGFSVQYSSTVKNAKINITKDDKEFENGGPVVITERLELSVAPDKGFTFASAPVVNADNATVNIAEIKNGVYTYVILNFKDNTNIKISGEAVQVQYSVGISDKVQEIAKAGNAGLLLSTIDASADSTIQFIITPGKGFQIKSASIETEGNTCTVQGYEKGANGCWIFNLSKFTGDTVINILSLETLKIQVCEYGTDTSINIGAANLGETDFMDSNITDAIISSVTSKENIDIINEETGEKLEGTRFDEVIGEIKKALGANNNVDVFIEVNEETDLDSSLGNMTGEALLKEVEGQAKKDSGNKVNNSEIAMPLDISFYAKVNGMNSKVKISIKETGKQEMTIKMKIPSHIKEEADGVERLYYIVRFHKGNKTVIPCVYDKNSGTIKFKSGKFSSYILCYVDTDKNNKGQQIVINPGYIPMPTETPAPTGTPVPSASPSPVPSGTTGPGIIPTETPVPVATPPGGASATTPPPVAIPWETAIPDSNDRPVSGAKSVKKGSKFVISNLKYTVTSVKGTRAVKFTGTKNKAQNVVIPASVRIYGSKYKVTAIAKNALKGNKKLKKLSIGSNVKQIGKNAFKGCSQLKNIVIKSNKLKANKTGNKAFKGINKKAIIKVPKGKVKQYKKLLKSKGAGKKIKVKKIK